MRGFAVEEDKLFLQGNEAVFLSPCLDSRERETVWHRLKIEAEKPLRRSPGKTAGSLVFYGYASDSKLVYRNAQEIELESFLCDPRVPMEEKEQFFCSIAQEKKAPIADLPLYSFKGRYFWFMVCFHQPTQIATMKVYFPQVSFTSYLPQIYRDGLEENSFLYRFMAIFQSIYLDLEEEIENTPLLFEPRYVDEEFLYALSNELQLEDSNMWSQEQLRVLLTQIMRFYAMKGTKQALYEIVALFCGVKPYIIEQHEVIDTPLCKSIPKEAELLYGETPYVFTVLLRERDVPEVIRQVEVMRIIQMFQPAHTTANFCLLTDDIRLGAHSYLGVNSVLPKNRDIVITKDVRVTQGLVMY